MCTYTHIPVPTHVFIGRGGSRKNIWGAWPLVIWEATRAKQNYYRTNYIKHVEKLGLNYPEKIGGLGKIWGGAICSALAPT